MTQEEKLKMLEAIGKSGIFVAGDVVMEKNVQYEIGNVESGGIGIQINQGDKTPQPVVDDCLTSPAALKYWKRLEEQGFVGHDCQLLPETSRRQAMYIADLFSDKLGLKAKWKPFETLWGISNLAQEKYKMQETGSMPKRYKDIDKVFTD